jgi:hypothetical protein
VASSAATSEYSRCCCDNHWMTLNDQDDHSHRTDARRPNERGIGTIALERCRSARQPTAATRSCGRSGARSMTPPGRSCDDRQRHGHVLQCERTGRPSGR